VPPGDPPPTRLVARPRPVIPRPPPRRSRRLPVLVGVALVAVLGCAGVAWAGIGTGEPARPATTTSMAQRQVEPSVPPAVATGTPPSPPARQVDWLAALNRLAALRARAFAERRPALLRRVYRSGPLLAADAASLTGLVPAGCRLLGARTSYTRTRIAARAGRAAVSTSAAMAPSRLICPGRAARPAAGVKARLRIVLVDTAAGVRIARESAG
jgi:hypothetical protein